MTYTVVLKTPAERRAEIDAAVRATKDVRDFYDFRSSKTSLPFIRVAESTLIYRMENFRTFIAQHEYVAREKIDGSFFSSGQENESVQQVQHHILSVLAKKGRADSVVPVIDVLRREKQREPLLITSHGVVVNGNRRLAGMRELYAESNTAYGEFSHVDCLVLPADATTTEIVDIEAALQAKPETRLDYDWIGDSLLIQRLLALGKNPDQVAVRLNRKPSEIRNSLSALAEANLYLKDWAKAEVDYGRVLDGEQFFKDLPAALQNKDANLQEASRVIAWNLFDNREELDDRLYAFNPTFGREAANVLDRLASELGVSLETETTGGDSDFDVDVDGAANAVSYQALLETLRNQKTREEAVEALVDVCRNVLESERGKKSGQAALKSITAANTKLVEADITRADPTTYDAIEKQLEQVGKRVDVLKKTVLSLRQSSARSAATPRDE